MLLRRVASKILIAGNSNQIPQLKTNNFFANDPGNMSIPFYINSNVRLPQNNVYIHGISLQRKWKEEQVFSEYETACAVGCSGRTSVSKILCIRQCISPTCYKDLYANDLVMKFDTSG